MLMQIEERAIAPLQDLREKAFALAASGGSGGAGLAFSGAGASGANLLGQVEVPDAEFVIPDTETKRPASPSSIGSDDLDASFNPGLDDFMPELEEKTAPTPPPVPQKKAPAKTQEVRVEAKPKPAPGNSTEDEFLMDFGEEEEQKKDKRVSTLPRSPSMPAPAEKAEEDLAFSFEDMQTGSVAESKIEPPITATEIPSVSGEANDEIIFSFDDAPSAPPAPAASAPASQPAPAKPAAEDSLYESISLDDLNLDFGSGTPAAEPSPSGATSTSSETVNPLATDLDLNLDLHIDMPADTQEQTAAASEASTGFDMSDIFAEKTSPLAAMTGAYQPITQYSMR
jgi:hypothetical protein